MSATRHHYGCLSRRQVLALGMALSLLAVTVGCDDAKIENKIVSQQTSGSADDGNDNNDPANGKTYPPGLQAKDNTTTASSDQPAFDKVGGAVDATPSKPPAVTKDSAVAKSFSLVKTSFVVSKAGAFTFDVNLEVVKPALTKNAALSVQVRANVLDAQGATIPNAQITDTTFKFDLDANGKPQVTPEGTPPPEPLDANGNYARRLSGPNKGVQLQPGNYQIELELRLFASAGTAPGGDFARVDHATASIKLR